MIDEKVLKIAPKDACSELAAQRSKKKGAMRR